MNTHVPLKASLATIFVLAILADGSAPVHAGGVTAGTLIENTAIANFDEAGITRRVESNTVIVRVDELLDVTVTSLDPGQVTIRPGDAVLTFEITNQGNGPEAFRLRADPAGSGNDFDVTMRGVAIDTNNNNLYEEGVDKIIASPETTAALAQDARLTVFVLVTVPPGATNGDTSTVALTATAVTGSGSSGTAFTGGGAGGGDAIVGATGATATARVALVNAVAGVRLEKSVALRDPFGGTSAVPGTIATFTIQASVSGTGSVANLVVTDVIPTGTTYVPGSLALDAAGLSDAADADAGTASQGSGVSVSLGNMNAGQTRAVTFAVAIDD